MENSSQRLFINEKLMILELYITIFVVSKFD